jgi:NADH-quinone oxidoreductase subunit F
MPDPITPQLTADWTTPQAWKLNVYEDSGGYRTLRQSLTDDPGLIVQAIEDSGLRGRGGAGFPTGRKWNLLDPDRSKPRYLVVNADESEPGACKDMPLLMASPHKLVEGIALTCFGIGAHHAFIYVRGEVLQVIRRLRQAVADAYAAGYLGRNILGSGFDLEVIVHAGAGAYICGEETALLESLEGYRGQPRLRPPFPAASGIYRSPTLINNVETIASVPMIIRNGPEWFRSLGTDRSPGMGIFSVSGHVEHPGQLEVPLGTTLRQLLDLVGGIRTGHHLKFWTPGGSSSPIFTADHLDLPLDYDSVVQAGSMLGTRSIQVFDETTSVVRAVLRWSEFYRHESCGKCTPCREGTWWIVQILQRLEAGQGRPGDVDKLLDLCDNIAGKAFCGFGDGAIGCVTSGITYFHDEFEAGLHTPARTLLPYEASTRYAPAPTALTS